MTKKTKKKLAIGAGVAVVGLAGYLYWKSKQPTTPAVPAAPATPAVPAATTTP